mgnify:CR=1 FL=1
MPVVTIRCGTRRYHFVGFPGFPVNLTSSLLDVLSQQDSQRSSGGRAAKPSAVQPLPAMQVQPPSAGAIAPTIGALRARQQAFDRAAESRSVVSTVRDSDTTWTATTREDSACMLPSRRATNTALAGAAAGGGTDSAQSAFSRDALTFTQLSELSQDSGARSAAPTSQASRGYSARMPPPPPAHHGAATTAVATPSVADDGHCCTLSDADKKRFIGQLLFSPFQMKGACCCVRTARLLLCLLCAR